MACRERLCQRLATLEAHAYSGGGLTISDAGGVFVLLEQILPNCSLHSHQVKGDDRGSLVALEAARELPFEFERVYFVFGTRPGVDRGFHAHRALEQWVVCVSGSCTMSVDDGRNRRSVQLDSPEKGLYIGPSIWREMSDFSPDAVLMVIASTRYDERDYIRNYDDFLASLSCTQV